MTDLIRVVLADQNASVLAGLRGLCEAEPDLRVVGTATEGPSLCAAVERLQPDVVVVEAKLPQLDGLACLRQISSTSPRTKVLMLSDDADGQTLHALLRAGADGLLLKGDPPSQTIQGVREAMAGALVLPAAARKWLAGGTMARRIEPLSCRESEVLGLVAQGLSNRQVAERLFVSENTVKFHLQNVFHRLKVANRTQASRWYLRNQEAGEAPRSTRLRVLIVEEAALVAEEIRDRLARFEVDVVGVADTGEQAIRLAEESHPDLVLMGIRLKGEIDGIQAAARIRERADIPVVYLTAHSDPSTVARAMEGAPFGHIIDPSQEKDLRIVIAAALSRARAEQALKDRNAPHASMLASIADAVVAVDTQGRISFLNTAGQVLSGWSSDEVMGKDATEVLQVVDEATHEALELPVVRALRVGCAESAPHDVMLVGRQGELIPVATSAGPVRDARTQLSGAIMVMRDQRGWRRLQAAMLSVEGQMDRSLVAAHGPRSAPAAPAATARTERPSSPVPRRRA